MKRFLALLMSLTLVLAFSSCGNTETETPDSSDAAVSEKAEDTSSDGNALAEDNTPAGDGEPAEEGDEPNDAGDDPAEIGDNSSAPLDILNTVWGSYGDDEKFAAAGGDMSEENMTMDGPGKFGLEDADAMDSSLGFPAADIDKIDDAASVMHLLNANTFTCGAYHVKNADDTDSVVSDIKENVMNRQWLCGFPDKLVIVTEGECVVAFFGTNDIADAFRDKLTAAYPTAQIVVDAPIE